MEPAETPSLPGTASAPDRADAAQRKLAEIWGGREAPAEEAETADGHGTSESDPAEASVHSHVVAERTLAEIWESQPESTAGQPPMVARREQQDALIAELRTELSESSQTLGLGDPRTVEAQLKLAKAQLAAGRISDAIPVLEQVAATIDPADPMAATTRTTVAATLASAYVRTRHTQLAIKLYESLLSDAAGASTAGDRLAFRIKLAAAHRAAGDVTTAIEQLGQLRVELQSNVAQRARLLEATLELATANVVAGRPRLAATIFEDALPLARELHGPDDRTTLAVRLKLAHAHHQAGQVADAISAYEELVADTQRALGPRDRLTEQASRELALVLQHSPPSA